MIVTIVLTSVLLYAFDASVNASNALPLVLRMHLLPHFCPFTNGGVLETQLDIYIQSDTTIISSPEFPFRLNAVHMPNFVVSILAFL